MKMNCNYRHNCWLVVECSDSGTLMSIPKVNEQAETTDGRESEDGRSSPGIHEFIAKPADFVTQATEKVKKKASEKIRKVEQGVEKVKKKASEEIRKVEQKVRVKVKFLSCFFLPPN